MGGVVAKPNDEKKSLHDITNYIATKFITTQSFMEMENMADNKYCNELIILTSDIIAEHFNEYEVEVLYDKIHPNTYVRNSSNKNLKEANKQKVVFFEKDQIKALDVKPSEYKYKLCLAISRYYVLVNHCFSAIITTIKPLKKNNKDNSEHFLKNLKSWTLSQGVDKKISDNTLCDRRLFALTNGIDYDKLDDNEIFLLKPGFCDLSESLTKTGEVRTLDSEYGIPELKILFDDNFDIDTGKILGMTSESKIEYNNAVKVFEKIFGKDTNNSSSEDNNVNKNFKDIQLQDYRASRGCEEIPKGHDKNIDDSTIGIYRRPVRASLKDGMIKEYVQQVKIMSNNIKANQQKLIGIIDDLFSFITNPNTGSKEIIINPKLTIDSLDEVVKNLRRILVNLYATCESDFTSAIITLQNILAKRQIDEHTNIENFDRQLSETITPSNIYSTDKTENTIAPSTPAAPAPAAPAPAAPAPPAPAPAPVPPPTPALAPIPASSTADPASTAHGEGDDDGDARAALATAYVYHANTHPHADDDDSDDDSDDDEGDGNSGTGGGVSWNGIGGGIIIGSGRF